ncbi:hypothetical protein Entas_4114 [Enterobacter soli]|uniref:DUF4123 domain-containing protein n=1 Tax=Enterobacter soli TaxID=885040 RepID=UPI000223D146|nr:DUF4123 domain-containing protein [Enterobacter soli]AEN66822.1 hypothetical protein Entas_4114 [Enterobacter soli]OAT42389.1 hypothetical protein M987_00814 [Enterobacter soli ATCC BAA-2102]
MNINKHSINTEITSSTSVNKWVQSLSSGSLFAILANTNGAHGVKAWYEYDGSVTPFGLYSNTRYAEWRAVMPVLVPVARYSRFLLWVEKESANHRGWGWLGSSSLSTEKIATQLRNLMQVNMPEGNTVFFRYWDAGFFSHHVNYYGDEWGKILPAFSDYWLNGKTHHLITSPESVPQHRFPLSIPPDLIDAMNKLNNMPLVLNALKMISEVYPERILNWPEKQLTRRLSQLLTPELCSKNDWLSIVMSELERA